MLLIRPKRPPEFQRGYSFSISDLLKYIFLMPFLFVAALVMKLFEEAIAVMVVAVPGLIVAYIAADGDWGVMWELIKQHWKGPVFAVLAIAYLIKAINSWNKRYD